MNSKTTFQDNSTGEENNIKTYQDHSTGEQNSITTYQDSSTGKQNSITLLYSTLSTTITIEMLNRKPGGYSLL